MNHYGRRIRESDPQKGEINFDHDCSDNAKVVQEYKFERQWVFGQKAGSRSYGWWSESTQKEVRVNTEEEREEGWGEVPVVVEEEERGRRE